MADNRFQFAHPGVFSGSENEYAMDWIVKYEDTCKFNSWSEKEHFVMFLEGTAKLWYYYLRRINKLPSTWEDMKVIFLNEFGNKQKVKFLLSQRKQKSNEPLKNYFYEIVDMCYKVNAMMEEKEILYHLFQGLNGDLKKEIIKEDIKTTKEFLIRAKMVDDTNTFIKFLSMYVV